VDSRRLASLTVALAGSLATALPARADIGSVTRCSSGSAMLAFQADDLGSLSNLSGDTGWFPSGSPVQARIASQLDATTAVGMTVIPVACWDSDGVMTMSLQPALGTGGLDVQYGASVQLYGQINTSVLGYQINWEGQIPVPYIGNLQLGGSAAFDPIVLPDSPTPAVSVSGETNPITLLSTNLLSAIIDITGISGGLALEVQGAMTTTYWSNDITVQPGATAPASLTSASATAPVAGPFGPSLDTTLAVDGTVEYAPSLVFSLAFKVSILGITVANLQFAEVDVALPSFDRQIQLTAPVVDIPLPQLGPVPATLDDTSSATLHLTNTGTLALDVEQVAGPAFAPLAIPPGGAVDVTVPASTAPDLVLATNDPSHPTVTIALTANGDGGDGGSDGDGGAEHAGCSAGGDSSLPMVLLGVAFLIGRRRLAA
jgi:MYXO-CTERM domain-containing protein